MQCRGHGESSRGFQGIYHFNIPRNVQQESGKCLRRFERMFKKILGNVEEDSGECWRRLRRTCKKIPGNVQADFGKCY